MATKKTTKSEKNEAPVRKTPSRATTTSKTATPRKTTAKAAPAIEVVETPVIDVVEAPARQPTFDEIAARAYQLFEQRGHQHGHDYEDWVRAETELRHRN